MSFSPVTFLSLFNSCCIFPRALNLYFILLWSISSVSLWIYDSKFLKTIFLCLFEIDNSVKSFALECTILWLFWGGRISISWYDSKWVFLYLCSYSCCVWSWFNFLLFLGILWTIWIPNSAKTWKYSFKEKVYASDNFGGWKCWWALFFMFLILTFISPLTVVSPRGTVFSVFI